MRLRVWTMGPMMFTLAALAACGARPRPGDAGPDVGPACTMDADCDDQDPCNGMETCAAGRCTAALEALCEDDNGCTSDVCDATNPVMVTCSHPPLDADGDGFASAFCGGDDCDDWDWLVVPGGPEVCGDGLDNNCDGLVDAADPVCRPGNDTCASPFALSPGTAIWSTFGYADDGAVGCAAGVMAADAFFSFILTERHDVRVQVRGPAPGIAVEVRSQCTLPASALACASGGTSATVALADLAAGAYAVVVDTVTGQDIEVSLLLDPPSAAQMVAGNGSCFSAFSVSDAGGFYSGSTATLVDSSTGGCGTTAAPNAVFRLDLLETQRVALTAEGSAFDTVLYVRRGDCTAGTEVGCNDDVGSGRTWSYLDLGPLDADTYWIFVDGNSAAAVSSGAFRLGVSAVR